MAENETMNFDELLAEISYRAITAKDNRKMQAFHALDNIWHYIRDNCPALIAGCQRPLRFRISNPNPNFWRATVVTSDGLYGGLSVPDSCRTEQEIMAVCERKADRLGLTAEFVGGEETG